MIRTLSAAMLFTSVSTIAVTASATSYHNSSYNQDNRGGYSQPYHYQQNPREVMGYKSERYQRSGATPAERQERQAMRDDCIKTGWMDNSEIQKWTAKHPGERLCYSGEVGDSQPMYRN